ncbi:hypothetical protein Cni_G19265 [Canna indica]|uniref:Uncharacterized protein n=1 Tax=Canna indica TaxID=4628 RepID=A0AAQ3KP62_9LILI|nr:hypothetical protein Cni_G19265 [Canna indica]
MGSWVRTITSPFRKACTLFTSSSSSPRDHKKSQAGIHERNGSMELHGEVMACSYEDVRVMWSILDKSRSREHMPTS